jgi:hypothetical protein
MDFRLFCERYFARLVGGYARALDDTLIRAFLHGHKCPSDAGGCLDACSRMFPALAAWLADPCRPRVLDTRHGRIDLELLARAVLQRAFDPREKGFWGRDEFGVVSQHTVEASMIAYGAWLLRHSILPTITPRATECLKAWLARFGSGPIVANNWNLFWIVNHAARKALGWEHSRETIDQAWRSIDAMERDDGWMTDGAEGFFDDYNWWVFGFHELAWLQMDGSTNATQAQTVGRRVRRRLEDWAFFFGADGSYSEYGRSLSYKFARLGCPILAHKLGLWPHPPGLLKRIVRRHLEHYDNLGAVDRATDTVRQTLSEFGHAGVRERYINTGHPYWCMQAFAAMWQLGDDDPLWSAEESPLPVESGDFSRTIRAPGWILTGCRRTGQVQRHSLGSRHGQGQYAAKYAKFLYSTHFPPNVGSVAGDFGPDSALCITDGMHWAHPAPYERFAAGDGWLRAAYTLSLPGCDVPCQTILLPQSDESSLRVHRLAIPVGNGPLRIVEGAPPLGYEPGELPVATAEQLTLTSRAACSDRVVLIQGLRGYTRALRPQGLGGQEHLNAVHARAITPMLESSIPAAFGRELILACRVLATPKAPAGGTPREDGAGTVSVDWRPDGIVRIALGGRLTQVPSPD